MISAFSASASSPIYSLSLPQGAGQIGDVAWSPSGTHLAAVSSAGWVLVWEMSTGELLHQKQVTRTPLLSVAWARQGAFLAVGCQKGVLRMLDEHLSVCTTYPFLSSVTRIAWSPHVVGTCVIVTGHSVTLLREESRAMRVLQYQNTVLDATWSGDGRQVAILCTDGLVEIWHARTSRLTQRFHTEPLAGGSLFWDQASHTMAVMESAGALHCYPLLDPFPVPSSQHAAFPPLLFNVQGTGRPVRDPSGRYLATTGLSAVHLYAMASPE